MNLRILLFAGALGLLCFSFRRQPQLPHDLPSIEANMLLVPADTLNFPPRDVDLPTIQKPQPVITRSFYMLKYEVSNLMYLEYCYRLSRKDSSAYRKALPDTVIWRGKMAYNEPYVTYYFRHPAYRDYPVVGVSYEQAIQFCDSMTSWYNAWPERKYKKVKFDLPTKYEWEAAAHGGLNYSPFPWGGPYLQNANGKWLANFRWVNQTSVYRDTCNGEPVYRCWPGGDPMGAAGMLNDAADITAPVGSYNPNDYGLYNMSGNVEEMVKEKGVTKGGSWRDTGYYLMITTDEYYNDSTAVSAERGFRIIMTVE